MKDVVQEREIQKQELEAAKRRAEDVSGEWTSVPNDPRLM